MMLTLARVCLPEYWVVNQDQISGYGGNDQLQGMDGNDDMGGGSGDDLLQGGAGNVP